MLLSAVLCLINADFGMLAATASLFLPPSPQFLYLPGIEFAFSPEPLLESTFALLLILAFISAKLQKASNEEIFALVLFSSGLMGFISALNPFQLFFFLELMLLPAFYLIYREDRDAAFKYFAYMQLSSILVLAGLTSPGKIGALLLNLGFAIKMGLFPFHSWLPDAHSQAPHYFSALLSGAVVACGAFGILRFSHALPFLPYLGLLSTLYGAMLAREEKDVKRVLACSTISQMGYAAIALYFAPSFTVLFLVAHGLAKASLFFAFGRVIESTGLRVLKAIRVNSKSLFISISLSSLGLAGFPPLLNFFAELGIASSLPTHFLFLFLLSLVFTILYVERFLALFLHRGGRKVEDLVSLLPALLLLSGVLIWTHYL